MTSKINLRPAQRFDIPALARITNAANAKSAIHKRVAPLQNQYPLDYYQWRLNIVRKRFGTANLRTIVAENASGEVLGQASWAVEGSNTALYKKWVQESTWTNWLEDKLIWVEQIWHRWITGKSIDYKFLNIFISAMVGSDKPTRPDCIHCHLIVVDPNIHSNGVGRTLIDWGKELALQEDLPLYLESNLEATGFYEKGGFSRLSTDLVIKPGGQEAIHVPMYVWEGEEREGRWLKRDNDIEGTGGRWSWKDDVLPK